MILNRAAYALHRIYYDENKSMLKFFAAASIVFCWIIFAIYASRPDWAAAMTVFPAWIWLVFGIIALPAIKSRIFLLAVASWLLFVLFQVEEWKSVLRSVTPAQSGVEGFRVTTVNCSGFIIALQEAFAEDPDILLVQESPPKEDIDLLLKDKSGYECVYGFDTSIIARGRLTETESAAFFTAAEALIDKRKFFIVSLRLLTRSPRVDLWEPECWRSQAHTRKRQREQLEEIANALATDSIVVVGGDFNVPQRDKIFLLLDGNLSDTFRGAARAWCNTILADFPLLRIDQIWTGPELSSYDASVRRLPRADHKLYTAQLKFTQTEEEVHD